MEVFSLTSLGKNLPMMPTHQGLPPREMSNLLLLIGYPDQDRAKLRQISKLPSPTTYQEHYQLYGHVQNLPIYDGTGCMPDSVGRWVFDGSRVRKLQLDELAKGKGVPGEWRDKTRELPYKAVVGATAVHIWTVVCDAVAGWLIPTPKDGTTSSGETDSDTVTTAAETWAADEEEDEDWDYTLPDLSEGGEWYQERVESLRQATRNLPDREEAYQDGLEALKIHRDNYSPAGPKYLQVLWWEFPPDHQEAVRRGSSMRFLVDPGEEIVPNPALTDEQIQVVGEFVDELEPPGSCVGSAPFLWYLNQDSPDNGGALPT
ncbi:hypothetical protein SEMRO_2952_G340930.1 [Seminavis robusta]|uniref:Uncharacterized protein n=1 Tax=Seminavis robusta TaxID=568900 RepID=A0A9N8HYM6_9STRA|nr:hypothetical protein SEMRO_2952_G340930.1 [Seminavis robusta]|eukprot:Sro2952_g340930.1 n/a (317) ;mRNA; r:4871-5821